MSAVTPQETAALMAFSRRDTYYWTVKETAILRSVYPTRGASAVQEQLPWRTLKGIYSQARQMDLKSGAATRTGVPKLRWHRSDEMDAVLRAEYPRCTQRGSIDKLAQRLGRPSWWVRRTAAHLGIAAPRHKMPNWTPAEDAVLQDAPHLGLSALGKRLKAAGFTRSETGIAVRLKRLQLSQLDPDIHSARDLALLMGVDTASVRNWIAREGLQATRKPGSEQSTWRIARKHVRAWVLTHVDMVDIRRVDKWWFVELLAGRG